MGKCPYNYSHGVLSVLRQKAVVQTSTPCESSCLHLLLCNCVLTLLTLHILRESFGYFFFYFIASAILNSILSEQLSKMSTFLSLWPENVVISEILELVVELIGNL